MKVCAVHSCRKDSANYPELTFFSFPRDPCAKTEWLDALGLKQKEVTNNLKVCEHHFKSRDFCAGKRQLKIHAVPVLHLGVGKTEPQDSDDEFMHCDSDNDEVLLEIKKITAAEAIMDRKIKKEDPEEKPPEEQEQETGRRPSRRAAREAAKKIYNTVRNYGCVADNDDSEVVNVNPPKPIKSQPSTTPQRITPRQRRAYQAIKVPPPNIDLIMECHEELLSTVQAEALLQAQLQYNMVMKTLRNMKASNVRIICQSAEEPAVIENSDDEDTSSSKKKITNNASSISKSPNIVVIQPIKKENDAVVPMELSSSVPSPAPILS